MVRIHFEMAKARWTISFTSTTEPASGLVVWFTGRDSDAGRGAHLCFGMLDAGDNQARDGGLGEQCFYNYYAHNAESGRYFYAPSYGTSFVTVEMIDRRRIGVPTSAIVFVSRKWRMAVRPLVNG